MSGSQQLLWEAAGLLYNPAAAPACWFSSFLLPRESTRRCLNHGEPRGSPQPGVWMRDSLFWFGLVYLFSLLWNKHVIDGLCALVAFTLSHCGAVGVAWRHVCLLINAVNVILSLHVASCWNPCGGSELKWRPEKGTSLTCYGVPYKSGLTLNNLVR